MTNPEATISEGLGTSEEDTTGSPANIGEPTARRQQRMDWQEKSMFPSKQQWQASFASGDHFVVHTTRHTTKRVVNSCVAFMDRNLAGIIAFIGCGRNSWGGGRVLEWGGA